MKITFALCCCFFYEQLQASFSLHHRFPRLIHFYIGTRGIQHQNTKTRRCNEIGNRRGGFHIEWNGHFLSSSYLAFASFFRQISKCSENFGGCDDFLLRQHQWKSARRISIVTVTFYPAVLSLLHPFSSSSAPCSAEFLGWWRFFFPPPSEFGANKTLDSTRSRIFANLSELVWIYVNLKSFA